MVGCVSASCAVHSSRLLLRCHNGSSTPHCHSVLLSSQLPLKLQTHMSSRAVSSADVPSLSAAASAAPRPARSPLYRDALSSVLSFLPLPELATAFTVNKEWSAAVQSMHPALFTVALPLRLLSVLLSSRLRRHVGQLVLSSEFQVSLTSNELPQLAHALPQLRSLSTALSVQPGGAPVLLPPQLQRLSVILPYTSEAQNNAAVLLSAIGQLQQLHTLNLRLGYAAVSLASLQQLPLLRDLELSLAYGSIVEQFAAELRALHWLHRVIIHLPFTAEQAPRVSLLTALLRDAPEEELRPLQWRDFALNGVMFTDELTPLLLTLLPSLERLRADLSSCTCFDFLTALPRLTHLELHLWDVDDDAWSSLLGVFASDGLARLHTLNLIDGPCSSDDLTTLLAHTPSLTNLILFALEGVCSLSFFLQLPKLAETLTQLTVECTDSWCLTGADLPPLHALQQLRELRLLEWPNEDPDVLTAADRAPFEQRPCSVLPLLELFEWTTR